MKAFVVTGTSRGIGLEIANMMLQQGHQVLGISRSPSPISHPNYYELNLDLGKLDSSQPIGLKVLTIAMQNMGRVDGFVHNAGKLGMKNLSDLSEELMTNVMTVNLYSAMHLIKYLAPEIGKQHGSIILVSSGAASKTYKGWGAYCISKAALNMYCQVLAVEEPAIMSVAVRPGVVDTEMQNEIRTSGKPIMGDENHSRFTEMKESGSLVDPSIPAKAIVKLAVNPVLEKSGQFINHTDI